MKILFLSFFFEPDLSAGSFRNTSLFNEMLSQIHENDYIQVITTSPNRYSSFDANYKEEEVGANYRINRIVVPKHSSGFVGQAKTFRIYYKETLKLIKGQEFDLVYASSSRMFTATLGRRCADQCKCPLYLDIRDIFVDSIKSVYENKKYIQFPAVKVLSLIESYTYRNAKHINLVSEGFSSYFEKYNKPSYSFFTNAIDDIFINEWKSTNTPINKPYIITYAGNIGAGQGLEKIIPEAAKKLGNEYEFHIIGDGSTKRLLESKISGMKLHNVKLFPPVPRKELIEKYNASTFLFFHLNEHDSVKKALPSKMFEYGAFDKPIIAGVGGYAHEFVEKYLSNYILFNPTDVDSFVSQMKSYQIKFEDRSDFKIKFSRSNINKELAKSILSCINNNK